MQVYVALVFLAAIWGASFLFLRISSPEFGPVALIFVRTAVASIVLLPFVWHYKQVSDLFRHWKMFLFVGAVSTALPFTLFSYTSLYLPAGNSSILNATTPFFSAIIAIFWLKEHLSGYAWLGLIVGFSGVYFLSFDQVSANSIVLLPVLAALWATFLYGFSSCYVKLYMTDFKPITVAAGSQIYATVILLPFAIFMWPADMPSAGSWWSAIAMGVISTAIALIIFFRLIQRVGVTRTLAVTYLIPLFGLFWGYLFLDEVLTAKMFIGGALVLLGVGFTSGNASLTAIFKRP